MKKKIEFTKKEAVALYSTAPQKIQSKLENTFGIEIFKPVSIMDRIKNFDDVLEIYKNTKKLTDFDKYILDYKGTNSTNLSDQAHKKLTIIAEVLNQSWVPDWANSNKRKWYPWFKMASFAFDEASNEHWDTYSICGSNLCFQTEELAIFAGKTFKDIYKIAFTK